MKFKDFIAQEIDVDTYNSYTDWGICFCGPCELTDEGKKEFEDILDLDVEIEIDYAYPTASSVDYAIVQIPDNENEEKIYRKVKKFLVAAAGYIAESEYNRLFKEGI